MDMQGSRVLAVAPQQAWDALNDPEVLRQCIMGCESLVSTSENQYSMVAALRIGPLAAAFTGKISLSELNPPHSYSLAFDGQGGPAGFGKGRAHVKLQALDGSAATCELTYTVHAQIGGKIAQLGQRVLDGAAKSLVDDFFKRFAAQLQLRHPEAASPVQHDNRTGAGVATDTQVAATQSETDGMVTPLTGMSHVKLPPWAWMLLAAIATGLFIYLIDMPD